MDNLSAAITPPGPTVPEKLMDTWSWVIQRRSCPRWPDSGGMGQRNDRNQWTACAGIGGRNGPASLDGYNGHTQATWLHNSNKPLVA